MNFGIKIKEGIDKEKYHRDIVWDENGQKYNFIITGMISRNKGQWDVVRAIKILLDTGVSNVHLSILGSRNGRMPWVIDEYNYLRRMHGGTPQNYNFINFISGQNS